MNRSATWTGKRIRHLRRERDLTQKALAAEVNLRLPEEAASLHQATVSRWESGTAEVSLRWRPALAAALGVPKSFLFEDPPEGWATPEQVAA